MTSTIINTIRLLIVISLVGCSLNPNGIGQLIKCTSNIGESDFSYYMSNEKTYYYTDMEKVKQLDIVDTNGTSLHFNEFSMHNYTCVKVDTDAK